MQEVFYCRKSEFHPSSLFHISFVWKRAPINFLTYFAGPEKLFWAAIRLKPGDLGVFKWIDDNSNYYETKHGFQWRSYDYFKPFNSPRLTFPLCAVFYRAYEDSDAVYTEAKRCSEDASFVCEQSREF